MGRSPKQFGRRSQWSAAGAGGRPAPHGVRSPLDSSDAKSAMKARQVAVTDGKSPWVAPRPMQAKNLRLHYPASRALPGLLDNPIDGHRRAKARVVPTAGQSGREAFLPKLGRNLGIMPRLI